MEAALAMPFLSMEAALASWSLLDLAAAAMSKLTMLGEASAASMAFFCFLAWSNVE